MRTAGGIFGCRNYTPDHDAHARNHPTREAGNYVPTNLPERYDAFIHLDKTSALHPLELHADRAAVPDLYPWGL
jgi:hypothetical protein